MLLKNLSIEHIQKIQDDIIRHYYSGKMKLVDIARKNYVTPEIIVYIHRRMDATFFESGSNNWLYNQRLKEPTKEAMRKQISILKSSTGK